MATRYLAASLIALALVASLWAKAPLIIATCAGPTTSEDLKDSCSLGCAIYWKVRASSEQEAHPVAFLNDSKTETAWVSKVGTPCRGQTITYSFPIDLFAQHKIMNFSGIDYLAAFPDDAKKRLHYARPKTMSLSHNEKVVCHIELQDISQLQSATVHFDIRPGDTIKLTVITVYEGAKGAPLAIGEIVPQGAH